MRADPEGGVGGSRAVMLDLFATWDRAGTCACAFDHPALLLTEAEVNATSDTLLADGLIVRGWETQRDGIPILTEAGRAHLNHSTPPTPQRQTAEGER